MRDNTNFAPRLERGGFNSHKTKPAYRCGNKQIPGLSKWKKIL